MVILSSSLDVQPEIQISNRLYETTQSWNVTDTIATNAVSISKLWFDDFFFCLIRKFMCVLCTNRKISRLTKIHACS